MARYLLFILLNLSVFGANAQKSSHFKIGVGYPVFIGTNDNDNAHYNYSINKRNYNLFLEKEFRMLKKIPEFRFTPGLAYTVINENYESAALGGGGEGNYKHQAFSTYLKLTYEIDRDPYVVVDYYFGVQAGYYLHSITKGSRSSWQVNPNLNEDHYSSYKEINTDGKDFFHLNYIGIIAGLRPLGDTESFIQPNIELTFYPSFATVNSYYLNAEENKSMIQISVSFGIGLDNNSKSSALE